MRAITLICAFLLLFGSVAQTKPQEIKAKDKKTEPEITEPLQSVVNFDSIKIEAIKKVEQIKADRKIIESNEVKSKIIESKVKEISREIKNDLIKIENQRDTVIVKEFFKIDSSCIERHSFVGRAFFGRNNCKVWKVDTITIK